MFDYQTVKPLLFKMQPEAAHKVSEFFLKIADHIPSLFNCCIERYFINDKALHQNLFDRIFLNPIGLAAGMDKNATMLLGTLSMGFGFTEVGTITPNAQTGNQKPRLWRHTQEESLQNSMGFNNDGMQKVKKRVQKYFPLTIPIGVNIGKNKITPEDKAINDYIILIKELHDVADYFVINISSPNTPGLRDLQNETFIQELFIEATTITKKPILLKISPDMQINEAIAIANIAVANGANGIIAINSSVDYTLLANAKNIGGISGVAIKNKSFDFFDAIAKELYGRTKLISVGGVDSAKEAYRRLQAGASLIELFSSLVFHGPALIAKINNGILQMMKQEGFENISQLIGSKR